MREDVWINNAETLATLAKLLPQVKIHLHLTPYQIADPMQPWKGEQENVFTRLLQHCNIQYNRKVYFENKTGTLAKHFQVLDDFIVS